MAAFAETIALSGSANHVPLSRWDRLGHLLRISVAHPTQATQRLVRALVYRAEKLGGSLPDVGQHTDPGRAWVWFALSALAILLAYFPIVSNTFAIHNDHDHLFYKSGGLLYHEAPHLISIARPIAAISSNLPLLLLRDVPDLVVYRCFAIATLVLLVWQYMHIATHYLAINRAIAFFCALSIFLIPPFYYSLMNASAYVPHLVTIALAAMSFIYLSRTDIQFVKTLSLSEGSDISRFIDEFREWLLSKEMVLFFVFFLLAMYSYPQNALIVFAFSVSRCLFGRMTPYYRIMFALRDLAIVALALAVYVVLTKAVYFPVLQSLALIHPFPAGGPGAEYAYQFADNPLKVLDRLTNVAAVAADLWILPQLGMRYIFLGVLAVALILLTANIYSSRPAAPDHFLLHSVRNTRILQERALALNLFLFALYLGLTLIFFVLSAAPMLFSYGGFVAYRTMVAPTAIAAVLCVYLVLLSIQATLGAIAKVRPSVSSLFGLQWALLGIASLAIMAVVAHQQFITITLAKHEFGYVAQHVKRALSTGADALVMVDPRKTFFPQEIPRTEDREGKPTMPYELGCYSTVCFSTYGIFASAFRQLGLPMGRMKVVIMRGEDYAAVDCRMFAESGQNRGDPQRMRQLALTRRIARMRENSRIYCFRYDARAWHVY